MTQVQVTDANSTTGAVVGDAQVFDNLAALDLQLAFATSTGEALGRAAYLVEGQGPLRVHYEELDPGRRSSRAHHHTRREECVFVIAGEVEVEVGDEVARLCAGGLVRIPPGPLFHCVWNRSEQMARLLVFSASGCPDEVVYTDSARIQ